MPSGIGKYRKHIQEIGTGLFIYEVFNFVYDWLFYPFALAYWGLLKGGVIVVAGSLVQCAFVFWLYVYMRIDWVGAHALRELETKEEKTWFERMAVWLGKDKKSLFEKLCSPIVFVALTLPIDPLIVALHYRRKHFEGISLRDWGLLISAVAAANLWWLLKVGTIVEGFKYLYTFVLGS